MAPPGYGDLGKNASDLFSRDFTLGAVKAEVKTKTASGVELKTSGNRNTEKGSMTAELETKYCCKEHGVTFTDKWKSSNVLVTELAIEDKLMKGLKTTLEASFEPNTGKKSAKVKNSLKNAHLNAAVDLDFKSSVPTVSASAVSAFRDFIGGASFGLDIEKQKLTKLSYGIAYQLKDFNLYGGVDNGTNFSGSVYQQVNKRLETGAKFSWASNTHVTNFGVAAKYKLEADSFVRVKVDNNSALAGAYSFKPNRAVRITVCALVDGKSLSAGGHQLGASLTFEQ